MKIRTRVILSAILLTPLLFFSAAQAVDHTSTASPEDKKAMLTRLEKRKAAFKTKLTAAEQTRLKQKCKASQGKLSSLGGRVKGIETSRNNVYRELVERLTKLTPRLQDKGVDTKELEAEIEVLETKIETFKTDLADYKQAVSDMSEMECETDPVAFKASLEAARTAREKVAADAAAVRAYVKETIKPTLQELRQQVEGSKKTTEGTN